MATSIEKKMLQKTRKFVSDMTAIYKKKYDKENKGKDLKKDKGLFPLVTFKIGGDPKVGFRSGALQGYLLAQRKAGKTQVCWSSHMKGGARHVPTSLDGKVVSVSVIQKRLGSAGYAEFKKNWVATMKSHGLLNADRGKTWFSGDEFHLEMPGARPAKGDSETLDCVLAYVKEVGEDVTRISKPLETDSWAKPLIAKHRLKLNIRDPNDMRIAPRDDQLAAMEFESKKAVKGKGKIFAGARKSTKASVPIKGDFIKEKFVPPKEIVKEVGTATKAPRTLKKTVKLDDLGVTLQVALVIDFETYKLLPQSFLRSATLSADLTKSSTADAKLKVTAFYSYKLVLKKNDPGPTGEVVVNYRVDAPGRKNDKKGKLTFVVDGLKSSVVKIQ